MILSDRTIRQMLAEKTLSIVPLDDDQIQPASVDVSLGSDFRVFGNSPYPARHVIDPLALLDDMTADVTAEEGQPFMLAPGEFVLGTTIETVWLPDDLVARVEGKSSLGRLGLLIHATAGFVDPGFCGQITLELSNVSPFPIKLWPGMRIGQLCFQLLDQKAERPYGHPDLNSKYQNQVGPIASRYESGTEHHDTRTAPAPDGAPRTIPASAHISDEFSLPVGPPVAMPNGVMAMVAAPVLDLAAPLTPTDDAVAEWRSLSPERRTALKAQITAALDVDSDVPGPNSPEGHQALLVLVRYLETLAVRTDDEFLDAAPRQRNGRDPRAFDWDGPAVQ